MLQKSALELSMNFLNYNFIHIQLSLVYKYAHPWNIFCNCSLKGLSFVKKLLNNMLWAHNLRDFTSHFSHDRVFPKCGLSRTILRCLLFVMMPIPHTRPTKSEVFALARFPAHLQKLNLRIAVRIFYSLKWKRNSSFQAPWCPLNNQIP